MTGEFVDNYAYQLHKVAKYANISISEAAQLPCDFFMLCFRNSYVEDLLKTEEGRKYLKDYKRCCVEQPDMEAIERLINKKGG